MDQQLVLRANGLRKLFIGFLALSLAYLVFWYAAAPRYGDLYNSRSFAQKGSRHFTEVMYLDEGSSSGSHLVGASSTSAHYSVVNWRVLGRATTKEDSYVYDPDNTARVSVTFRVNDCRAPGDWIPVTLHLRRWWINHSQTIVDPGSGFSGPYTACQS